jgi:eukaryotic-like serine/threonine-protein kinase
MTLVPGTRLGPYEVLEAIGAGGMGEVYRARDTRLQRDVAIKTLHARFSSDPQFRHWFEREGRAISRVSDPHICTVYDVGQSDDVTFIVMELVEGETLRAWLRRQARPDVASVMRVATQIARALGAAHAAGIVHRDVKPDNVIVRPDGTVKVLDFGVAKVAQAAQLEDLATRPPDTMPGTVVGTTEYMAPEQARGVSVDARADVFSFGVVLYEMLAGEAPFRGATMTDTLVAVLQHHPPPVKHRRPDAGSGLSRVVARCLEKDPSHRYATGRHVAVELDELLAMGNMSRATPPSIAVLPFVNMSTDPENDYFCDGIAEDLISALTKIEHLHVAARTSSFAFKKQQMDLKEIGRILNVRSVLEGSVRKAGSRLRVTAQLVNLEDGYQVWSERYDRQLEDVFAIQDEISAAIVTALKGTLLNSEKAAIAKRQTENVEAFELYLRGRHHWHAWTPEGFEKARTYFEQAIALDPDYALAYVGLADCDLAGGAAGLLCYGEALPRAKSILARAIALDDEQAEAWTLLGVAHFSGWECGPAHESISRALALSPRLPHAHSVRATILLLEGRHREAVAPAMRSVDLDPLAQLWSYVLMLAHLASADYAAADERAQTALHFDEGNWTAHYIQGFVRVAGGEFAQAARGFELAARCSGQSAQAVSAFIYGLARAGEDARAEREMAALLDRASRMFVPALSLAGGYLGLGDRERAFEWLEKSYEERDIWLRTAWWNPLFRELRSDPRMVDLLRRMELMDAAVADGTLVR